MFGALFCSVVDVLLCCCGLLLLLFVVVVAVRVRVFDVLRL